MATLPPRDEKGRFISYTECKKKKCAMERSENAFFREKMIELQKTLKENAILKAQNEALKKEISKNDNFLIKPLCIFFAALSLFLLLIVIAGEYSI